MTKPSRVAGLSAVLALVACGGGGDADEVTDVLDEEIIVWSVEPVPLNTQYLSVWGRANDDVWAVGWDGGIVHYDGVEWTREVIVTTSTITPTLPLTSVFGVPLPNNVDVTDPTFIPPPVFAVGWEGTILERMPDGVWVEAPRAVGTSTLTQDLFAVHIHDENSGLAVGDQGTIFVWDGVEWDYRRLRVPGAFSGEIIEPRVSLAGVWTPNGNEYTIVGSRGAAFRSFGIGDSFVALDTRIEEPLRGIWGTGNNNIFAVGLQSTILELQGSEWRRITNRGADDIPVTFLFGIHGRGGNDVYIVGWQGVAVRFNGGRYEVEDTTVEADLRDVWTAPIERVQLTEDFAYDRDVVFAVGANGTILRREPPPPEPPEPLP
ncbi:MAG: hypothetical protein ACFB9M_19815 [Myxococcota bacterium]